MTTIETLIYQKDLLQLHVQTNEEAQTAKANYFINGVFITQFDNLRSTHKALFNALYQDFLFCYSLKNDNK